MRDYSFTLDEFCNALGPSPFVRGRSLALWLDACDSSSYFYAGFALCCKRSFEIDDTFPSGNRNYDLIQPLRRYDLDVSNSSKQLYNIELSENQHFNRQLCKTWIDSLSMRSEQLIPYYTSKLDRNPLPSREYINALLTSIHDPLFSFFSKSTGLTAAIGDMLENSLRQLEEMSFTPICLIQSAGRLQRNNTAMVCFYQQGNDTVVYLLPSLNPDDIRILANHMQLRHSKNFFRLLQVVIYFFAKACYGALPTYIPRSMQESPVRVPLAVAEAWLYHDAFSGSHHTYVPDTIGSDTIKFVTDRALLLADLSALWNEMGHSITHVPAFSEYPYNIANVTPAEGSAVPGFLRPYEPPVSVQHLYEELSAYPETAFAGFFAIQCILQSYLSCHTNKRKPLNCDKAPFFVLDGSPEEFQNSSFDFVTHLPVCETIFISPNQRISKGAITNRLEYYRLAFIVFEGEARRLTLKQCQLIACSAQTIFLVNAVVPPEWSLCARLSLRQAKNHLYTEYRWDRLAASLFSAINSEWYSLAVYPFKRQQQLLRSLRDQLAVLTGPEFENELKPLCNQLLVDASYMDRWLRQKPPEGDFSAKDMWYMTCPYYDLGYNNPSQYIDSLLSRFCTLQLKYGSQLQCLRDSLPNLPLSNNHIPPASLEDLIAALNDLQKQLDCLPSLIDDLQKEIENASRPLPAFSLRCNQGMRQYEDAARRLLKDRKIPARWRASMLPPAAIALLLDHIAAPAASSTEPQAQRFIDLLFADGSPFCASAFLSKESEQAVLRQPTLADFQKFLDKLPFSADFEECCRSGIAWQDDSILYLDYDEYWQHFLSSLDSNVVAGSQLQFQREVLADYIIYAKHATAKDPHPRPQYRRKDANRKDHPFLRLKSSIKDAR